VLYSELLKTAKAKYGEDITVSNIRIQNIRQGLRRRQEVLVDVYKVKP
jgi:precorrin isomerase